jgi:hypothetical protein
MMHRGNAYMATYAEINAARFCNSILDIHLNYLRRFDSHHPVYRHSAEALKRLVTVLATGVYNGYFDEQIANDWYRGLLRSEFGRETLWVARWFGREPQATPDKTIDGDMLVVERSYSAADLMGLGIVLRDPDTNRWKRYEQIAMDIVRDWLKAPDRDYFPDDIFCWFIDGFFSQESARTLVGDRILDNQFDLFCAEVDRLVCGSGPIPQAGDDGSALQSSLAHSGIETSVERIALAITLWENSWDTLRIGRITNYKVHDDVDSRDDRLVERAARLASWAARTVESTRNSWYLHQLVATTTWLLDAGDAHRRSFLRKLGETITTMTDRLDIKSADLVSGDLQAAIGTPSIMAPKSVPGPSMPISRPRRLSPQDDDLDLFLMGLRPGEPFLGGPSSPLNPRRNDDTPGRGVSL